VNILLCVIAYSEYFIVMWWWRQWGETVFWPCFHISLPYILNAQIYSDGFKLWYIGLLGSWTSSIAWYSEQHTFQKPVTFNPLVRKWNSAYSVWTARKK